MRGLVAVGEKEHMVLEILLHRRPGASGLTRCHEGWSVAACFDQRVSQLVARVAQIGLCPAERDGVVGAGQVEGQEGLVHQKCHHGGHQGLEGSLAVRVDHQWKEECEAIQWPAKSHVLHTGGHWPPGGAKASYQ